MTFDEQIISLRSKYMYFITKPNERQFRFGSWVSDIRYFEFSVLFNKDYKLDNLHNSFRIIVHKDILRQGRKIPLSQICVYNKSVNLRAELEYYWYVQLYFLSKKVNKHEIK